MRKTKMKKHGRKMGPGDREARHLLKKRRDGFGPFGPLSCVLGRKLPLVERA
jgi:hypothetical protein